MLRHEHTSQTKEPKLLRLRSPRFAFAFGALSSFVINSMEVLYILAIGLGNFENMAQDRLDEDVAS